VREFALRAREEFPQSLVSAAVSGGVGVLIDVPGIAVEESPATQPRGEHAVTVLDSGQDLAVAGHGAFPPDGGVGGCRALALDDLDDSVLYTTGTQRQQ
jgi:hypothetical protein